MLTGQAPSGDDFDAYVAFFTAGFPAQKMVFVPNGTSADIVAAYQNAVMKMQDDPEYQTAKASVLGAYEQVTGKAAQALFEKGTTISPETRAQVVGMLESEYNAKLGD
jgi:hypothetical protein